MEQQRRMGIDPYVFISYGSRDRDWALLVAERLEAAGVRVWVDRQEIRGGTSWTTGIAEAVEGCSAFLLLWSDDSLQSRNVKQEIELAWQYGRPYLPLRLQQTPLPKQLEYPLAGVQWIDVLDRPEAAWLPEVLSALNGLGLETPGREGPTDRDVSGPPDAPGRAAEEELSPAPTNLPASLTSFVGRGRELGEVKRLIGESRLLTLTGAGGSGKTRLALEVARELLGEYPDGAWMVELATLPDAALLSQSVAAALGVREEPGRQLSATLIDYLRPRSLLLVLDNCEHLVVACAQLAEALLRACPNLRILATSREVLGVFGEAVWRVPTLSLPEPSRVVPGEDLARYDAIRLFVERARAAQPGFTLSPENGPIVLQICRRLDGIPLGLELAAARVDALSVDQIAARLSDRFRLLTRGSRTALPRQQTLRATLDWSYELLTETERVVLRRLAAFVGSFALEAAEAVCAGDDVEDFEVVDFLTQLVAKSLVVVDESFGGKEKRYRLLETIRQYAEEKLVASGEGATVCGRHRNWHLALAERAAPALSGPDQLVWLTALEQCHDDLRVVLGRAVEAEDAETVARLSGMLSRFWQRRGYLSEGQRWLDMALTKSDALPAPMRARALGEAGVFARQRGDHLRARALLEESLTLCRGLGDRQGVARTLHTLGIVALGEGDFARAKELLEEGLELCREQDDRLYAAGCLTRLGEVAHRQGDYARATALHEESLAIRRQLEDKHGIAASLLALGQVVREQFDSERATTLLEESLTHFREIGDRSCDVMVLLELGYVALDQGDDERAKLLFEESLALSREVGEKDSTAGALLALAGLTLERHDHAQAQALHGEALALLAELGDKHGMARAFEGLAALAVAQAQSERAAQLLGAAEGLREAIGAPLPPHRRSAHERVVAAVRSRLDAHVLTALWEAGRRMSAERAVAYALGQPVAV